VKEVQERDVHEERGAVRRGAVRERGLEAGSRRRQEHLVDCMDHAVIDHHVGLDDARGTAALVGDDERTVDG
jgi:hypothetical protein